MPRWVSMNPSRREYDEKFGTFTGTSSFDGSLEISNADGVVLDDREVQGMAAIRGVQQVENNQISLSILTSHGQTVLLRLSFYV